MCEDIELMITVVHMTSLSPSKLGYELMQYGITVHEALAVSEIFHLIENFQIDAVLIGADIEEPELAQVHLKHLKWCSRPKRLRPRLHGSWSCCSGRAVRCSSRVTEAEKSGVTLLPVHAEPYLSQDQIDHTRSGNHHHPKDCLQWRLSVFTFDRRNH